MNIKSVIVITAVVAAVALTACRREERAPMKLGAELPAASQVRARRRRSTGSCACSSAFTSNTSE